MNRAEAEAIVAQYIEHVAQYAAVSVENATKLLGEERCQRMLSDRIRGLGPKPGTVYPWNVADYLVSPELNARPTTGGEI